MPKRPNFDPLARFRVISVRGVDLEGRIFSVGELLPDDGRLDMSRLHALYCAAVIDPVPAGEVVEIDHVADAEPKRRGRRKDAA